MKRIEYGVLPEKTKGFEKINDLLEEMQGIVNKSKSKVKALSNEEDSRFEQIQIQIEKEEETRALAHRKTVKKEKEKEKEERSHEQINNKELRSISNKKKEAVTAMNTGTNEESSYVINTELSKEIINELEDRSYVYKFFNGTTVKGNYMFSKKTS